MVKKMKSLLKKIFIDNWQRKILALIIAIITWIFINNSLTVTKTISNVPIKIINLAKDKTIQGLLPGNILSENISITITGHQNFINQIDSSDLEVIIDLKNKTQSFTTFITKSNLISKNSNINLEKSIKKLQPTELTIKLSQLVKERIPILITKPLGKTPKGYQFLDIWPYQLYISLQGPEEIIKDIKTRKLQLTFNLNEISQNDLDIISAADKRGKKDVVSFFIPTAWKKIYIPEISPYPIEIDDPNAKALRLDFIKKDFIPINLSIPITLFFSLNLSNNFNPKTISLATNEFVQNINDINIINLPLLVQDVSKLFLDIIKEKMNIVILIEPKKNKLNLTWNLQILKPLELEKKFIKKALSEQTETIDIDPKKQKDYLRRRFRSYIYLCQLFMSPEKKLDLKIQLKDNKIYIVPNK